MNPHDKMTNNPQRNDMTDPLKIMDEIEADALENGGMAVFGHKMQTLRTAIEAQAEELAQKEARIARLEGALKDALAVVSEMDDQFGIDRGEDCIVGKCESALNEHPRKSAAAIKAETAHTIFDGISQRIHEADQSGIAADGEYSTEVWNGQRKFIDGMRAARLVAKTEIDRIKREAKDD